MNSQKRKMHVQAIREHGRGFGHMPPNADERDKLRVAGRPFRRAFRGVFKK